jgi:hypothetical protein
LENEAGHFLELSRSVGAAGRNISALSLAETAEYGIARMIVDDTDKGAGVLREAGYPVKITDVLNVETSDAPGALADVLRGLAEGGVNVSYIYGYSRGDKANLVMKVGDPEKAAKLLG